MDTSVERMQSPARKQRRSIAEKRRIVEETLTAGASVARVARARGVNANQVFQWRRLYRAGRLGGTPAAAASAIKLLLVTVETSPSASPAMVQTALKENPFSGQVFVFRGRRGDLIKLLWGEYVYAAHVYTRACVRVCVNVYAGADACACVSAWKHAGVGGRANKKSAS